MIGSDVLNDVGRRCMESSLIDRGSSGRANDGVHSGASSFVKADSVKGVGGKTVRMVMWPCIRQR